MVSNDEDDHDDDYIHDDENTDEQIAPMPSLPPQVSLPSSTKLSLEHVPTTLPSLLASCHRKNANPSTLNYQVTSSTIPNFTPQVTEVSWAWEPNAPSDLVAPDDYYRTSSHLLDPVDAMIMELHQEEEQHDPLLSLGLLNNPGAMNQTDLTMVLRNDVALGRRLDQILKETADW